MRLDRRALLRASAICAGGVNAGCVDSLPSMQSDPSTPPETATPAETGGPLTFGARVVDQPSTDSPATIRTALTNAGERPVMVGTGPTLVFRAGQHAFEHGIVLSPETYVGPNETPDAPADGCWRYTDDDFLVQDVREWHTLDPDESFVEHQRVYTVGTGGPCLPTGEYRFGDEDVVWGKDSRTLLLTVVLTVHEDQQMSVSPKAIRPRTRQGRSTR